MNDDGDDDDSPALVDAIDYAMSVNSFKDFGYPFPSPAGPDPSP